MSHEIFPKYFIEYLFFCSAHGFDIELYDILYSIFCKLYILQIGVLDWHIHCAREIMKIIKIVEHGLDFHLGSCKHFDEVENVSGNFFFDWYRILLWNFEICTISLFGFGWWYTLMKNKHQISIYLGRKKMVNILQITFSNGFSFKKNYSFFLFVCLCLSVCLSLSYLFHFVPIMVSLWNFQEWLPMTEVISMQKFKVRNQKSRLQRSKPKLSVSGP